MIRRNCFVRMSPFVALLLLLIIGSPYAAFRIDPQVVNIAANMGEKMAWIDVIHAGGGPIAVELSIINRVLDIDGENKDDSLIATKEFTLYPSQLILQPNQRARVQIKYVGKQKLAADKSYYLFSSEVPLPIDGEEKQRMNIQTLVNYYTIINHETGKTGKLTFVSSKSLGDGKVELVVANRSPGRVKTDRLVISVGKDKIKNFVGKKNSVMPGYQRRFVFDYGRPVTAKEISFE